MSEMDVRGDSLVDRALDEETSMQEIAIEIEEADAVEQHREMRAATGGRWRQEIPFDVDPFDAADQERTVDIDEDDYR
ncbi:hypothetical protein [Spongiactinospora sp. TRM90649]|uniref:hypothetical protein n=1 Tax=Spongiactinospora sp. TRM90649 TaxID=3031114 RepID=UPI0023F895B5|nr:hypothetical protein [Spongiactinospora sp. TRM90649]MDF5755493.1 hypothetical protein [Spongiactinospora sp. TRM90649]